MFEFSPPNCCACWKLIRCDDTTQILYTGDDLSAYEGHTVKINGDAVHTWEVVKPPDSECTALTSVTVDTDVSATLCLCYKLTDCLDPMTVIHTRSDLSLYVGMSVILDGYDSIYLVAIESGTCTDPLDVTVLDFADIDCTGDTTCASWGLLLDSCIGVQIGGGWTAAVKNIGGTDYFDKLLYSTATAECGNEDVYLEPCGTGRDTSDQVYDAGTDPCTKITGTYLLHGRGCCFSYSDVLPGCIVFAKTAPDCFCSATPPAILPCSDPNDCRGPDASLRPIQRVISLCLKTDDAGATWYWKGYVALMSNFRINGGCCDWPGGDDCDCCFGFTFGLWAIEYVRTQVGNEFTFAAGVAAWMAAAPGDVVWSLVADPATDVHSQYGGNAHFCTGDLGGLDIIKHERCATTTHNAVLFLPCCNGDLTCTCTDPITGMPIPSGDQSFCGFYALLEDDSGTAIDSTKIYKINGKCWSVLGFANIPEVVGSDPVTIEATYDTCSDCTDFFHCGFCNAIGDDNSFKTIITLNLAGFGSSLDCPPAGTICGAFNVGVVSFELGKPSSPACGIDCGGLCCACRVFTGSWIDCDGVTSFSEFDLFVQLNDTGDITIEVIPVGTSSGSYIYGGTVASCNTAFTATNTSHGLCAYPGTLSGVISQVPCHTDARCP